tara:strand:- start:21 stop:299 length:279 start_codon:yes stop_codon:yes gene_type:complete
MVLIKNLYMLNKKLTLQLKILTSSISVLIALELRLLYFLLPGFGLAIAFEPPPLSAIIYQMLLCPLAGSVIPTEEPQYIMEDELSPPKSNHK